MEALEGAAEEIVKNDLDEIRQSMADRSTEELASILRNRNEEEWRPEVFEIVSSILKERGVSAGDILARRPEGVDVIETQELVTVGHFFNPADAHLHRAALEQAGIKAWVSDEATGKNYGVGVGERLQVRAEDEERALEVLEEIPTFESQCPDCGSSHVTRKYQCDDCGHEWVDERTR
ncbi:MAG TPA: DUF2007 domain-containing protein [Thermoanaerobaculia bacterium]